MLVSEPARIPTTSPAQIRLRVGLSTGPAHHWKESVVHSECTLHQLSPYIGKLKSSIAADLVASFSSAGDLIADPFCGAGTIPLEAKLAGRRVFASDISPYAYVLTDGKLNAPRDLATALQEVEELLSESERKPTPDLRSVPAWVRQYFHPSTLKETIQFSEVCRRRNHSFAFSCLLGILHHQRPGFLSYPSSHLVPYLRVNKFPTAQFPALYEYRPLRPRLLKKVERAYKRAEDNAPALCQVATGAIERLKWPEVVDAVITSPPYMNALDYGRDNRLRLWFLDPTSAERIDGRTPHTLVDFTQLMKVLSRKVTASLKPRGYCVLVIGDSVARGTVAHTADVALRAFLQNDSFEAVQVINDTIPDIRRSRRDYCGVKGECILVLRRKHVVSRS